MKFAFEVGDAETHQVEFSRSAMWGAVSIKVDGKMAATRSVKNPGAHFNLVFAKRYTFEVGADEQHEVTIEHQRPMIFAGFRPQTYRVFLDGKMIKEHTGY